MQLAASGITDTGRKRDHNEDSFLVDEGLSLFVVADGMGGHAGGGTASRIAVETIDAEVRKARTRGDNPFSAQGPIEDSPVPEVVRGAVETACAKIFRAAQSDSRLA